MTIFKGISDKFSCKSSQKFFGPFLDCFQNVTFLAGTTAVATFGQHLIGMWLLFIPTSGHTEVSERESEEGWFQSKRRRIFST